MTNPSINSIGEEYLSPVVTRCLERQPVVQDQLRDCQLDQVSGGDFQQAMQDFAAAAKFSYYQLLSRTQQAIHDSTKSIVSNLR